MKIKIGDLVKHRESLDSRTFGLVVGHTKKKVWRTNVQGKKVKWGEVNPELHATVLFPHNDGTIDIPIVELEIVNGS